MALAKAESVAVSELDCLFDSRLWDILTMNPTPPKFYKKALITTPVGAVPNLQLRLSGTRSIVPLK